jgi:hypothetical protein
MAVYTILFTPSLWPAPLAPNKNTMPSKLNPLITLLVVTTICLAAQSIRITSPKDGTIVHPGDSVAVELAVSGGTLLAAMIVPADPINNEALLAPPFHFSIKIPSRIASGIYSMVALGSTAESPELTSPRIAIDVEQPVPPRNIRAIPGIYTLLSVGTRRVVQVIGTYGEHDEVDLSRSTRTSYTSDPPGIISVTREGLITGLKPGSARIIIRHLRHQIIVKNIVVIPAT